MTAPTYPSSTDVSSGQATLAAHYNNLRADALRLGATAANGLNLGQALARFSQWARPEYLATNRIRVAFSAARPPTLVINGTLLQATAHVDLPSPPSGASGLRYIFANRSPGSTSFSLSVSESSAENADSRLIGTCYWNGIGLEPESVKAEELGGLPYHIQTGSDGQRPSNPALNDVYIAHDTQLMYIATTAGSYDMVLRPSLVGPEAAGFTIAAGDPSPRSLAVRDSGYAPVYNQATGAIGNGASVNLFTADTGGLWLVTALNAGNSTLATFNLVIYTSSSVNAYVVKNIVAALNFTLGITSAGVVQLTNNTGGSINYRANWVKIGDFT